MKDSSLEHCLDVFFYQWNATLVLIAQIFSAPTLDFVDLKILNSLKSAKKIFETKSDICPAWARASDITTNFIKQAEARTNPFPFVAGFDPTLEYDLPSLINLDNFWSNEMPDLFSEEFFAVS